MTEGVGRGSIFNHRDPLNNDDDDLYTQRTVERFQKVLASADRKMFAMMNLNKQLWVESDIRELFDELCARTTNFVFVGVNCIKNLGGTARHSEVREFVNEDRGCGHLILYNLQCVGDNTGSYFRDDFDAARIKRILVDPFFFSLASDPLPETLSNMRVRTAMALRMDHIDPRSGVNEQPNFSSLQQAGNAWKSRARAASKPYSDNNAECGVPAVALESDAETATIADTYEIASTTSAQDVAPLRVRRWTSRQGVTG